MADNVQSPGIKQIASEGPILQNNTIVHYRGNFNPTFSRVEILL
jgi:hypothetical protein